ncbi:MAG: DUF167 domain-containing protein [Ignavibacteria bacterium]|nr:DUF167 domain-containing protein [Ignavibacteria bacterium]
MKITVKVKPNSHKNEVLPLKSGIYEIYTTVVPEKGKANKKVIELLAKEYKVSKSNVILVKGETSKLKIFEIIQ